jgi:hypothetical protein
MRIGSVGISPLRIGLADTVDMWDRLRFTLPPSEVWASSLVEGLSDWLNTLFWDVRLWFEALVLNKLRGRRDKCTVLDKLFMMFKSQLADEQLQPLLLKAAAIYSNYNDSIGVSEHAMVAFAVAQYDCIKVMLRAPLTSLHSVVNGDDAKSAIPMSIPGFFYLGYFSINRRSRSLRKSLQ